MSPAIELGPRLRASTDQLSEMYALLEERSAWLRGKALAQWSSRYPIERFMREIAAGHVWYWKANEAVAATVTLYPTRPDYYPPHVWNDAGRGWYVARLAVTTRLAGQGIGRRLVAQIEHDATIEGLHVLRLDVVASNPFLEAYYTAVGFRRVAVGEIKSEPCLFLEKALAS
jgi:GNAT superfamily N-acetyltransferase